MNACAPDVTAPVIVVGRPAPSDLPGINAVVEAAVMGWALPERVKRLAMPACRYDAADMDHLTFALAFRDGRVAGIAAWEAADPATCPGGRPGLLLHGLYVDPSIQHAGLGRALVGEVVRTATAAGAAGVLVRAQRDARGFFDRLGFRQLAPSDPNRDYEGRYWLPSPT